MDKQASISVVIPAWNAQDTLPRAIESVLTQTHPPIEIIVVDDGSSDATGEIAGGFLDKGVSCLRLKRNMGASAARNAGILAARGDWIAFLDADDEWLPRKLERQAQAIAESSDPCLIFCASEEVAPSGEILGDTFGGHSVFQGRTAWKKLLRHNFVATPTVLASRWHLHKVGGFDESLKVAEDQDLWIRLALAGNIVFVNEALVRVHVRTKSLSTWSLDDQLAYTIPMVQKHLATLRDSLSVRECRVTLGERLHRVGIVACLRGHLSKGIVLLLRSAALGYRPLAGIFLTVKIPASLILKRPTRSRDAITLVQ